MPPSLGTERSSVQLPLLRYASEIGWAYLTRDEAITLRRGESGTLFYDVLREKLIDLNPGLVTPESADAVVNAIEGARPSIEGNAEVLAWLRGQRTVYVESEKRDRNVTLIDYERPSRNRFHVTDEWTYTNGQHTNRADVVFLVNGVPVALVETKAAHRKDAVEKGVVQLRRYHRETPELVTAAQVFDVTQLLDFYYGVTWNLERKGLSNWKDEEPGSYERKVKRFFARERFLQMLRDWIVFFTRDDELRKVMLHQHQTRGVEKALDRTLDPQRRRGLVWHTQGSGKTLTMMAVAEQILRSPAFQAATVLMIADRIDLEGQLTGNLESYGLTFQLASSKKRLRELLSSDYRGLIVSMIHKFDRADADLCVRENVFVLVDEAHRSTGGDLGTYLLGALPNATLLGFTGTPIDRTAHGQGTFKVFGADDPKGYLDKYSIKESIEDGTTLRLHYTLAPNDIRVPLDRLDAEFLDLAEAEGISDFEELDRILSRAVGLKAFLKARDRVQEVAAFVAKHFRENVAPLGLKAFLVAVDREACALYKKALDQHLAPEASAVVYTAAQNDEPLIAEFHLAADDEKKIRKAFARRGTDPQILIVTEKLLTGFDAPILYCMYLDKPMRDHTLLQAMARVNRPYEPEGEEKKAAGLVIDFVGIFERLEKALAFDSNDVSGVIENLDLLKKRFETLMRDAAPPYLALATAGSDDKALEAALEALAEREQRERFFEVFHELRDLYEILSPDAFLRPYVAAYGRLSFLHQIVRNQMATGSDPLSGDVARKTEMLVRELAESEGLSSTLEVVPIDEKTLAALAGSKSPPRAKILNLGRSLARSARDKGAQEPYLIPIAERAEAVIERFDERQIETEQALAEIKKLVEEFSRAETEREELGFDLPTFTHYRLLRQAGVTSAREIATATSGAFERWLGHAYNASKRRELKAELYRLLLPVVGREQMVGLVEQMLKLDPR